MAIDNDFEITEEGNIRYAGSGNKYSFEELWDWYNKKMDEEEKPPVHIVPLR